MTRKPRVLLLGVDFDLNIVHFVGRYRSVGLPFCVLNLREIVANGGWEITLPDGTGALWTATASVDVSEVRAVFWRPIDLAAYESDAGRATRWRDLMRALTAWLGDASRVPLVINRASAHRHNKAKGLHEACLQSFGLRVPDAVTSADPATLRDFAKSGRTVLKAYNGKPARAREVSFDEVATYDGSTGPLHLQRLIEGQEIRAHVVGEKTFTLKIDSPDLDYRRRGLFATESRPVILPEDLAVQLQKATRLQGLVFAGWDLKLDSEGRYWCLECNPMPAFAAFDRRHDGAIAEELIRCLAEA